MLDREKLEQQLCGLPLYQYAFLNTEDLEFGMHEFITYKIPDDEDDIDDAEEEGGDVSSEDEE